MTFLGYQNNEKATREMLDEDGWIHTGDIGFYDEDERFYFVDRIKELIKQHGCQVSPSEMEQLLLTHDAVAEAAVTSIPDEVADQLAIGFVILKKQYENNGVKGKDISKWC